MLDVKKGLEWTCRVVSNLNDTVQLSGYVFTLAEVREHVDTETCFQSGLRKREWHQSHLLWSHKSQFLFHTIGKMSTAGCLT